MFPLELVSTALIDQMPEPVIVADPTPAVLHVNTAFYEMYGYAPEAIIGAHPMMMSADEDRDVVSREILARLRRGSVWRGTLMHRRRNGSVFACEITAFPLRLPSGEVLFASVSHVASLAADRSTAAHKLAGIAAAKSLTARESQVLELLVLGRTGADIATVLDVSVRTARFHIGNVLDKLEADSRSDLLRVLWFL